MKLSQKRIDDLLTLIEHSRRDIRYGEGGSYNMDAGGTESAFDEKSAKKSERAIEFIQDLILTRD